jgi:hypothetical protein
MKEPFAHAPYVHPFNAPKYHAQQLRALNYAKAVDRRLLWVVAHDWPVAGGDEALSGETLEKARRRWLQLHDKSTNGIMGLLPLVRGMPVCLTATEDDKAGAFKNAKGELVGWQLSDAESARVGACNEPEVELHERPLDLRIKLQTATKHLRETSPDGIFILKPKVRVWARDAAGQAKVKRLGFPVVPEFGGTIHAYCGDTLDAMLGDLLEWYRKPSADDMHKAYISKSRIRMADHMLLVQPYSPHLFRQGELPGPRLLMEVLRGNLSTENARLAWRKFEKEKDSTKSKGGGNWVFAMPLPCRRCTDEAAGIEVWKPLKHFNTRGLTW